MGGRAAALLAEDDDQPKSRAAQLLAEPDEPVDSAPKGMRDVANYWEQHYSNGKGNADEGSILKGILGRLLGDVGNMASFGAAPAAQVGKGAAAFAAKVGKDVAAQGAAGAIQGAGQALADGEDMQGVLKRILEAGGVSGAIELGLNALGGTAGKVGDMASWLGRKADNTKAGSTSRIRDDLIEKFGIENGPDKLGELVRKYSPSSLFSPKTSAAHLSAIESQLVDEGTNLAAMTRQAGAEGADAASAGAMQGAQNDMLSKAAALDSGAYSDTAQATANNLEGLMNRSASKPLPQVLEKLIGSKAQYGDDAFRKVTGFADEDAKSQAALEAWKSMKGAENQAISTATPDTAARFHDSQKTFGELSSLNESLQPRASTDDAAGNAGTAMISAAVGGALHPAGFMSALTSGTNNAVRQMTGGVAHDLFANTMHPAGDALHGIERGLERLPSGAIGAAGVDADADSSRGHQAYEVVEQALKANPRMLGSYGQQLMQAEDFKAEVSRLIDDDPKFARLVRNLQAAGVPR